MKYSIKYCIFLFFQAYDSKQQVDTLASDLTHLNEINKVLAKCFDLLLAASLFIYYERYTNTIPGKPSQNIVYEWLSIANDY